MSYSEGRIIRPLKAFLHLVHDIWFSGYDSEIQMDNYIELPIPNVFDGLVHQQTLGQFQ